MESGTNFGRHLEIKVIILDGGNDGILEKVKILKDIDVKNKLLMMIKTRRIELRGRSDWMLGKVNMREVLKGRNV